MQSGQPFTDHERWPWHDNVAAALGDVQRAPRGIVVACSALRRVYLDRIRAGANGPRFVFLAPPTSWSRMKERQGHFMPTSLVESQFRTLERSTASESDVLHIPANLSLDVALKLAISKLAL